MNTFEKIQFMFASHNSSSAEQFLVTITVFGYVYHKYVTYDKKYVKLQGSEKKNMYKVTPEIVGIFLFVELLRWH